MGEPFVYLGRLAARLGEGMADVAAPVRVCHARYLKAAQNSDGGFSGREGGSDLYYTGFALRGLALLDELSPEICERTAAYLRSCLQRTVSVIDLFSLLYSAFLVELGGARVFEAAAAGWHGQAIGLLQSYRSADGGYAKMAGGRSGSVYHTFLVSLCHEILGEPLPCPDDLQSFIASRRREDGGFVEIAPMKRSGTNPTAAAIGVLQILGDIDEAVRARAGRFLAGLQSPEGGFQGNARAPVADLLSSFTAGWTLAELNFHDFDLRALEHFARSCALDAGGFRGGLWDDRADVEYTFYGLGCLALGALG